MLKKVPYLRVLQKNQWFCLFSDKKITKVIAYFICPLRKCNLCSSWTISMLMISKPIKAALLLLAINTLSTLGPWLLLNSNFYPLCVCNNSPHTHVVCCFLYFFMTNCKEIKKEKPKQHDGSNNNQCYQIQRMPRKQYCSIKSKSNDLLCNIYEIS